MIRLEDSSHKQEDAVAQCSGVVGFNIIKTLQTLEISGGEER